MSEEIQADMATSRREATESLGRMSGTSESARPHVLIRPEDRDPVYASFVASITKARRRWAQLRRRDTKPVVADWDEAVGHDRLWWSRVVRGERRFAAEHLGRYLDGLGIEPAAFLGSAFPRSSGDQARAALRRLAERAHRPPLGMPSRERPALSPRDAQALRRRVEAADRDRHADPGAALKVARAAARLLGESIATPESLAIYRLVAGLFGTALRVAGDLPGAAAALDVGLELAAEPSDELELLIRGSSVLLQAGSSAAAAAAADAAWAIAVQASHPDAAAAALQQRAQAAVATGAYEMADRLLLAALAMGEPWRRPHLQQNRVRVLLATGKVAEALQLTQDLLSGPLPPRDRGYALWMVGEAHLETGRLDVAQQAIAEAYLLLRSTEPPHDRALLLLILGLVELRRGDPAEATRRLTAAQRELASLAETDPVAAQLQDGIDRLRLRAGQVAVLEVEALTATWRRHVRS